MFKNQKHVKACSGRVSDPLSQQTYIFEKNIKLLD